jgi:hypothetical protein
MVGMSESGVRNLIKRGTLRAVQLDGRWLIPAAVIEDKLGVSLDARPASDAASIRAIGDQPVASQVRWKSETGVGSQQS